MLEWLIGRCHRMPVDAHEGPDPEEGTLMRTPTHVGLAGLLAVAAYASLGILHLLVLNPLAAVPGTGLGQIYDSVHQAGQTMGVALAVLWALLLTGLSGAVLRQTRRPAGFKRIQALLANLALVSFGGPSLFMVSFWSGISLADTFGISGGAHAPWALGLYGVSAAAILAFLGITVTHRRAVGAATH